MRISPLKITPAAFAALSLLAFGSAPLCAQSPAPAPENKPLDQSFPDKVGAFARASVKKGAANASADANDSAEAKYQAASGEINWSAMAFATPEKAQAALESTLEKYKGQGAKVQGEMKNAEGKVRYAALETKEGPAYCWVNKKQKTLVYVATGKAPDISKFMELQTTW